MMNLLEIRSLTVQYGPSEYGIQDVNFSLGYREIAGIVGESGSGKTTLLKSIMNLHNQSRAVVSGEIVFEGKNITNYTKEQWRQLRGNDMAIIFQNPGAYLNPVLTIGKQFVESIRNHRNLSKHEAYEKAQTICRKLHLRDSKKIMNSYPFQLSGGMKQRVAIAMALALEPKLILADEPTSALDPVTQTAIARELLFIRETFDTSIIIITHNIRTALYLSDRISVMKDGKIIERGCAKTIEHSPEFEYTRQLFSSVPRLKGCFHET